MGGWYWGDGGEGLTTGGVGWGRGGVGVWPRTMKQSTMTTLASSGIEFSIVSTIFWRENKGGLRWWGGVWGGRCEEEKGCIRRTCHRPPPPPP